MCSLAHTRHTASVDVVRTDHRITDASEHDHLIKPPPTHRASSHDALCRATCWMQMLSAEDVKQEPFDDQPSTCRMFRQPKRPMESRRRRPKRSSPIWSTRKTSRQCCNEMNTGYLQEWGYRHLSRHTPWPHDRTPMIQSANHAHAMFIRVSRASCMLGIRIQDVVHTWVTIEYTIVLS